MKEPRLLVTGLGLVAASLLILPADLTGQSVAPFRVKLTAPDAARDDQFGCAVAADGGALVVGSFVDERGPDSGVVYLYQLENGAWRQRDRTAGRDTGAGDMFGFAVALSRTTALAGAPFEDDGGAEAGAAYAFAVANGRLRQEDKLAAADAAPGDWLGTAVAVAGDRAVAGAPGRDRGGRDAGGAYVFERGPNGWSQQAVLEAGDPGPGDRFGQSLAVAGDLAVVGAPFGDDRGTDSGKVYVFRHRGARWIQEAELTAPDGAPFDAFGYAVASDGQRIVVGAPRHRRGGAVYVYRPAQTGWELETRLDPPGGAGNAQFGVSVATDSALALVGSRLADDAAPDAGAVSLFRRSANRWLEVNRLVAGDGAPGDELGLGIALSGLTVVAGAYRADVGPRADAGSVYVLAPQADLSLELTSALVSARDPARDPACSGVSEVVDDGDLVPGCRVLYTLVVSNDGPDEVPGVRVEFPVTAGAAGSARRAGRQARGNAVTLTNVTWSCSATGGGKCAASGNGDVSDPVTLPAGARLTYRVTARIPGRARGTLERSASLDVPFGVLDSTPPVSADSAALTPVADTSIELRRSFDAGDPTPGCAAAGDLVRPAAVPGCTVTYALEVGNEGPSEIDDVSVTMEVGLLPDLTWTCTAARGASCKRRGRGNVENRVALPRRGHVTYSLRGTVPPAAVGTLDSSAAVALPEGVLDPTPSDQSQEESATLRPVVEAAVEFSRTFDPVDPTPGCAAAGALVTPGAVPGCTVIYTLAVRNDGPSQVAGVPVSMDVDLLPDLTWTCIAAGGAECSEQGRGNVEDRVVLAPRGRLAYSLRGTVPAAALGTLDGSASVILPEGVVDPTPTNQSQNERAPLSPVAALTVTLASDPPAPGACALAGPGAQVPGCPVGREMTIASDGPSTISFPVILELEVVPPAEPRTARRDVRAASSPGSETGLNDLEWTCEPSGGAACSPGTDGNVDDQVTLPAGGEVTYRLTAGVDGQARGELTTSVELPDDLNVPFDPIAHSLVPVVAGDVVTVSEPVPGGPPGTVRYEFRVENPGPSAVDSARDQLRVLFYLPPAFSSGAGASPGMTGNWTCTPENGATCSADGSGDLVDTDVFLPAAGAVTYVLSDAKIASEAGPFNLRLLAKPCVSANVLTGRAVSNAAPPLEDLTGGVAGVIEIDEDRTQGETVVYEVTLRSEMARTQFNNPGDELEVELPAELDLTKAECVNEECGCKAPACVLAAEENSVTWNGAICPGGTIELTIEATIKPGIAVGTTILSRGRIYYDPQGDGINDETEPISVEFEVRP